MSLSPRKILVVLSAFSLAACTVEEPVSSPPIPPASSEVVTEIDFKAEVAYLTGQCLAAVRAKSPQAITRAGYQWQPLRGNHTIEGSPVGFFSNTSRQSVTITQEASSNCHIEVTGLGVNTSRNMGSARERELYELVFTSAARLGYTRHQEDEYSGVTEWLVKDGFRTKVISSVSVSHGQRSTSFRFWSWGR